MIQYYVFNVKYMNKTSHDNKSDASCFSYNMQLPGSDKLSSIPVLKQLDLACPAVTVQSFFFFSLWDGDN